MNIEKSKIAIFTDLHLGKHNNSGDWHKIATDWCDWFIDELKAKKIKDVMFMGDWHDNRSEISVHTLDVSAKLIDKFEDFNLHMIVGNHDIPYKNHTNVSSVSIYAGKKNIEIYSEATVLHTTWGRSIGILPWGAAVSDLVHPSKLDVIFGHLEVESFKMNSAKVCDHGIKPQELLDKSALTFTGHFHIKSFKNYKQGSIIYTGNPFQMDFGDQHDQKGYTILDLDDMSYTWHDNYVSPVHHNIKLSDIIANGFDTYKSKFIGNLIKLNIDVDYASKDLIILFEKICSLQPLSFNPDYTYIARAVTGDDGIKDQITSIDIRKSINDYIDIVDVYGKEEVRDYMLELYDKCR